MKMVAASKLRRAQEAAEAARPYADRMARMVGSLSASVAGNESAPALLRGTGAEDTHLIVVATSDRGLCGAFNSGIVRAVRARIDALEGEGRTVKLLVVGRKGRDQLRRDRGASIVESLEDVGARGLAFADAAAIAANVARRFDSGEFDVCTIYYNRFRSAVSQVVTPLQLIPLPPPDAEDGDGGDGGGADTGDAVYEFEPDEEAILLDLLPRNVAVQIFRALLENAASEQGARMMAMDNATRNAGEMIDGLTGVRVSMHMCRWNSLSRGWHWEGGYEPIIDTLAKIRVDQLVMEFSIPVAGSVSILRELPEDRLIGLGCLDPRSEAIPSAAEIAARVEEAMRHVDAGRLSLNPDCGFAPDIRHDIPLDECYLKLTRQVEAARMLRERHC